MYRSLFAALVVGALAVTPFSASAADKSAFTEAQKKELNELFKSFIMNNPDVMISSVEAHYNKQAESQQAQTGRLDETPADLVDANTPAFGPKDAKVTVVQFFDYNCGFCKQVANDFDRIIKDEKEVRFVFKELPILSETSEMAARYALAAHKQGKYLEFHNAVMNYQGPINDRVLQDIAKDQKIDVKKLEKDVASQDIRDSLMKNVELARTLGARGTPFFVIGKERVPGAIGYTRMKEMIAKEKSGGTAAAPASATAPAAAAPAAAPSAQDPEIQAEIEKAKRDTSAMIEELKQEALKIQKDAEKRMEAAQKEAAKEAAKDAAKEADKK